MSTVLERFSGWGSHLITALYSLYSVLKQLWCSWTTAKLVLVDCFCFLWHTIGGNCFRNNYSNIQRMKSYQVKALLAYFWRLKWSFIWMSRFSAKMWNDQHHLLMDIVWTFSLPVNRWTCIAHPAHTISCNS